MSGVRFEDLPEPLKAQVRAQLGDAAPKQRRKKDRSGEGRVAMEGWCHACGQRFTSTSKWEAHVRENRGHGRLDMVRPGNAHD